MKSIRDLTHITTGKHKRKSTTEHNQGKTHPTLWKSSLPLTGKKKEKKVYLMGKSLICNRGYEILYEAKYNQ